MIASGVIARVSPSLSVTAVHPQGNELVYAAGRFVEPYEQSSLSLTTGEYQIERSLGWRDGTTIVVSEPAGQAPLRGCSWEDTLVATPTVLTQVYVGHGDFGDPVVSAAASKLAKGPIVWTLRDPIGFATSVADAPGGGGAGWKNVSFANVKVSQAAACTAFITSYIAAGGVEPDMIALDLEDGALTWYIEANAAAHGVSAAANFDAIWEDPDSAAFRALLPEYATWQSVATFAANKFTDWNNAASKLQTAAMRFSYWDTAKAFWPNVKFCNYGDHIINKVEADAVRYFTTFPEYYEQITGSHMAPEFYGFIQNAASIYGSTPFEVTRWEVNRFRAMRRSAPDVPMSPWIAYPSFSYGVVLGDYHRELVYHVALGGAERFLYFNPGATQADDDAVHRSLKTLQDRLGNKARSTATTALVPWGGSTIVSGMQTGVDRWHWRVTVQAPGAVHVAVDGKFKLPIAPGEHGVWHVTNSASVPSFVVDGPVLASALTGPQLVWPNPDRGAVINERTGARFSSDGEVALLTRSVRRLIAAEDLLLSPRYLDRSARASQPLAMVWPFPNRRVIEGQNAVPFSSFGTPAVLTPRVRRLLKSGDLQAGDLLSTRDSRVVWSNANELGADQSLAALQSFPILQGGYLSVHVIVDDGAGSPPKDRPVGAWELYASNNGVDFLRVTSAKVDAELARLAPVGAGVRALVAFDGIPGSAVKLRYKRTSGGGYDSRLTMFVNAQRRTIDDVVAF